MICAMHVEPLKNDLKTAIISGQLDSAATLLVYLLAFERVHLVPESTRHNLMVVSVRYSQSPRDERSTGQLTYGSHRTLPIVGVESVAAARWSSARADPNLKLSLSEESL